MTLQCAGALTGRSEVESGRGRSDPGPVAAGTGRLPLSLPKERIPFDPEG